MLVPSMNQLELTMEVFNDFEILYETTANRLSKEYDRERRKLKIDKRRVYARQYEIKTKSKNPWIISVCKAPAHHKYNGEDSIHVGFVTWYYGNSGLTVFQVSPPFRLRVFYGHFFKRYNERMNLQLNKPVDLIKRYFLHNTYAGYTVYKENETKKFIGFSPEGIMLGEPRYNDLWLVNKTFVSKDLCRTDQDAEERATIARIQERLQKKMQVPAYNAVEYDQDMSVINVLQGASML